MTRKLTAIAPRGRHPRYTVRLRLTLWYSGLFLISGITLLAVTYALVVRTFVGNPAASEICRAPGSGCHVISSQQARAIAVQEHAAVLHELLSRSALALALVALLSIALGWFIAGRALRPLRIITAAHREISAAESAQVTREHRGLAAVRKQIREIVGEP